MAPTGPFKSEHVTRKGHYISFTHKGLGVTVRLAVPGQPATNKMAYKLKVTLWMRPAICGKFLVLDFLGMTAGNFDPDLGQKISYKLTV